MLSPKGTSPAPAMGNPAFDPREGCSHPPPPSPSTNGKASDELRPALRAMRGSMVRELIRRLRRKRDGAPVKRERGRRRKRKAAIAMSASVMAFSTGAVNLGSQLNQPAIDRFEVDPTKERVRAARLSASESMKEALAEEEGVRLTVYRDVAGYPTVGVGHLVTPQDGLSVGERISYDQALDFLEKDIVIAENAVRRLVGDLLLYQHEFDALVDLVYNVGEGNVSERRSPQLNAAISSGDYDGIAEELAYTHAAGRYTRGLEFRSERRQAIFMDAAYEDPRAIEVDAAGRVSA